MISNKRNDAIFFIRFFKRVPLITIILIIMSIPITAQAFDILLGTGETGTFSHFAGRLLCRVINSHSNDLNCRVATAPDDVDNLTNLQGGSLDIGLIDSRMLYDAMTKKGNFEFLDINYQNLRGLVPRYEVPMALAVRSDANIESLDDLKGKRINAGAPRSLQHLAFDTLIEAKNWERTDFSLVTELPPSQSQDTMAFCHGTVQAMLHIGVHPDSSLQQLFRLCKAKLVDMQNNDIAKLVSGHPGFVNITIPADLYPSNPGSVKTFGTRAILVASEDLDGQTVNSILDAIYSDGKRLQSAHPAMTLMEPEAVLATDLGVKLHPGATQFFSR